MGTEEMLVLRENMSEKNQRVNTLREGIAKINFLRSNMQCNDRLSPTWVKVVPKETSCG